MIKFGRWRTFAYAVMTSCNVCYATDRSLLFSVASVMALRETTICLFNVLHFFYNLDGRFYRVTEDDKEAAYDAYTSWDWDMSLSFFENWSNVETLVREMGRKGCAAEVTSNRR